MAEAAQAVHQMAAAVARVKVASAPNVRSVLSNTRGMAHQCVATIARTWARQQTPHVLVNVATLFLGVTSTNDFMSKRYVLKASAAFVWLSLVTAAFAQPPAVTVAGPVTNILVLLADDLGDTDVARFGSKHYEKDARFTVVESHCPQRCLEPRE